MAIKEEETQQERFSNKRSILIREDLEYSAQKLFTYSVIGLTAIAVYATGKLAMFAIGLAAGYFLYQTGMLQKVTGKIFSKKPKKTDEEEKNSGSESSPPESSLNQSDLDPVAKFQQRQSKTQQLNHGESNNSADYLPDFKGALKGFYEENIKTTLETKTAYYENLLKENLAFSQRTQKIAIALGPCRRNTFNKENMKSKTKKSKNQIITVPTQGTTTKILKKPRTAKSKSTKLLKVRTPISKEKTCAYYDCMVNLVSQPENDRIKITELTRKCKCSKEEVARTKAELKHKLIHELARDYKNIGENLGRLAIFAGYTVHLRLRQMVLEKKNGKEQKQIDDLKKEVEELKNKDGNTKY
ncbi:32881_t:CDS:2 [Racocetra persica]|uniref:32881_t:CDS:1 n=1 Tax=Racocetra persica TaxID=160502 RepID=A0ACA9N7C0_9GLOM|nr:32881_t:CDS:2 [Racocetra persica]